MDGVVVVHKPEGMTSHDVVARIRRLYGIRRVGHTGTLDPLATGVLVVCLGQATRIVEYLTASQKEYIAGVTLGVTTDTDDATGHVISETDASGLTEDAVRAVLPRFCGAILQTPPMVSAVHHAGKRLYELAREGIEVERKPRPVEIERLEMTEFAPGRQARMTLQVACSTGTYIRTLAADIGAALGVGGMMQSLVRTRAGAFVLADAHTLEDLAVRQEAGTLAHTVRPIAEALRDWTRAVLEPEDMARIAHGQAVTLKGRHRLGPADAGGPCVPTLHGPHTGSGLRSLGPRGEGVNGRDEHPVLLVDSAGHAVGIARAQAGLLVPVKVFIQDSGSRI